MARKMYDEDVELNEFHCNKKLQGHILSSREMKKAGPPIRRELLAYLEQREVFELANVDEMSEALRERMRRGAAILEMLKQSKFAVRKPETMLKQVEQLENGGNQ